MANELTPVAKIEGDLRAPETLAEIQAVAPAGSDVNRVIVAVMQAIARDTTGNLVQCSPASIRLCVIQSVELGLLPSGTMGDAYLVPFKGAATLVPGYRGLQRLALESGVCDTIGACEVYENEDFEYVEGDQPRIVHKPNIALRTHEKKGVVAVYAVARRNGAVIARAVLSTAEVNRVEKGVPTAKVWGPHWVEMAKKTAIRRLIKQLPINPVKAHALATVLDQEEAMENADVIDVRANEVPPATIPTGEAAPPKGKRTTKPKTTTPAGGAPPQPAPAAPPATPPADRGSAAPDPGTLPESDGPAGVPYDGEFLRTVDDCSRAILHAEQGMGKYEARVAWRNKFDCPLTIAGIRGSVGGPFATERDAVQALVWFALDATKEGDA